MKICSHCKKEKSLSEFYKTKTNRDGLSYLCKPCSREQTEKYRTKNRDTYYQNQKARRETEDVFISNLLYNARTRAEKKGREFTLTPDDIKNRLHEIEYHCEITGQKMTLEHGSRESKNQYKVSLDRIDSSKGYTPDNIQLICNAVNIMKSNFSVDDFEFWIGILHTAISSQAPLVGEGSTAIETQLIAEGSRVHHKLSVMEAPGPVH